MRITLDLDDRVLLQAKLRALDRGVTLAQFIEEAIRNLLAAPAESPAFRLELLTKRGTARPGVDWDDRDSVYARMEDES